MWIHGYQLLDTFVLPFGLVLNVSCIYNDEIWPHSLALGDLTDSNPISLSPSSEKDMVCSEVPVYFVCDPNATNLSSGV